MKTVVTTLIILLAPVAVPWASDIQMTDRDLSDTDIEKISALVPWLTNGQILSFDLVTAQIDQSRQDLIGRAIRRQVHVHVLCTIDGTTDTVELYETDDRWYLTKEDIVAIYIRDAAEKMPDAKLREKLWIDYENYMLSSTGSRSCRKDKPTSNIPLEEDG